MNSHDQIAMTTGTELEDVKTSNSVPIKANGNSNEESSGVKTSNLHPAGISNDWNEYFNSVLSEAFNRLLHSKSLSDIAEVFKYAGKEIGNKEFVTAVLLFQIYEIIKEDKAYLSNRGYDSLSEFIKDLKGTGINSRVSFYNYVRIGRILLRSTSFSSFAIADARIKITYNELFANFSKIKYLEILERSKKIRWKEQPFTYAEIGNHFLHDSCREFKTYMKGILIRINEVDIYRDKKIAAKQRKAIKNKLDNKTLQIIPPMDDNFEKIYREVHTGHLVRFIPNINQEFLENARACAESRVKQRRDELNRRIENSQNFMSRRDFFEKLKKIEDRFVETMVNDAFFMGPVLYSSPNTIKSIIRDNCKTKTDCELAKAFLINRLHSEPELKKYLAHYGVTKIKDFAYNVLDIGESQYKRLKKIGANLKLVDSFQGDIDLMAPGFLEKLYFLDRAIKNHNNDQPLITRYLNHLSAKQFREFARDPSYCPDNEPINKRDYNTASLLYRKYKSLIEKNESVAIIGLQSERCVNIFDDIIRTLVAGKEHFARCYPEIPWPHLDEHESKIA